MWDRVGSRQRIKGSRGAGGITNGRKKVRQGEREMSASVVKSTVAAPAKNGQIGRNESCVGKGVCVCERAVQARSLDGDLPRLVAERRVV